MVEYEGAGGSYLHALLALRLDLLQLAAALHARLVQLRAHLARLRLSLEQGVRGARLQQLLTTIVNNCAQL